MSEKVLLLGGPGAGKTTRLLKLVEGALSAGVAPQQIAFVAFSKAAAEEAKHRASQRFGIALADLPNFRTLHSLCFRELGLHRSMVMNRDHFDALSEMLGEQFSGSRYHDDITAALPERMTGDQLLFVDNYCRTTCAGLADAHRDHGGELDWWRLRRFHEGYAAFKADAGLMDFTDMLERYVDEGRPVPVRLAIVDEAQDLTMLQWRVAHKAFGGAEAFWIAGDDDQSIHRWAGAAQDYLLSLDYRQEHLNVSHRLPKSVFAFGQSIIQRVNRRFPKAQVPTDREGVVNFIANIEELDLAGGSWLLLARTKHQLNAYVDWVRSLGFVYQIAGRSSIDPQQLSAILGYEALRAGKRVEAAVASAVLAAMGMKAQELNENYTYDAADLKVTPKLIWHDALVRMPFDDREYYLSCLRRGEKLTQSPRIRVETIHGAKGAEAENVLLSTALTYRVQRGFELDPDNEHRVFYVGATRAMNSLHVLSSQTFYDYSL